MRNFPGGLSPCPAGRGKLPLIMDGIPGSWEGPAWLPAAVTVLFLGTYYASLILHEIGHAAAARMVGAGVYKVTIGTGRKLLAFEAAGIRWEFGWVPLSGMCHVEYRDAANLRARDLAVTLGGPAATLLILAGAAGVWGLLGQTDDFASRAAALVGVANVLLLFGSLLPFEFEEDGTMHTSDALHAWRTLALREEDFAGYAQFSYFTRVRDLLARDFAAGLAVAESRLTGTATDVGILSALLPELLERKDRRAAAYFQELMSRTELTAEARAMLLTEYLRGVGLLVPPVPEEILETVEPAADALGRMPAGRDAEGLEARAVALAARGHELEAAGLLQKAAGQARGARAQARHQACRAAVEVHRDDLPAAWKRLATALAMDPACASAKLLRDRLRSAAPAADPREHGAGFVPSP